MADAAPTGAWFNPIAEFLGPAYLRNAFTTKTDDLRSITQLCELLET
jgi:hypothetical protein